MKGETQLILKLVGELLGKLGDKTRSGTLKGKLPPEIKRRVDSYNSFSNLWSNGDDDILALVALADLMAEKSIKPLKHMNEDKLQLHYGVNSLSEAETRAAVERMKADRDALHTMKLKCEAMRPLATTLAARALMGGPANASQITFDRLAAAQVKKVCDQNERAIKPILSRLDAVIEVNQKVLEVYRSRG